MDLLQPDLSLLDKLARLSPGARAAVAERLEKLSPKAQRLLQKHPAFVLRPKQRPPLHLPWSTCLMEAGRGWGKTHGGAHFVIERARHIPKGMLVGPTLQDVRKTMIEGESGLLAQCPPDFRPEYRPGLQELHWPNSHVTFIYSADRPDRLRGPNMGYAWADEIAAWRFLRDAWRMMKLCLRKWKDPRTLATTTPRTTAEYTEIRGGNSTHIIHGTTFENISNLSAKWFRDEILPLLGTALGCQEVLAELIADVVGALLTRAILDEFRITDFESVPRSFARKVIAVDPQAVKKPLHETGIVATARSADGRGWTTGDYSINGTPDEWAGQVMLAYREERADAVVVERNHGGEMCAHTIKNYCRAHDLEIPNIIEVTASHGKKARAEPFVPMFVQGRIRHVGTFSKLEDQWCTWVPGESEESPNRLDAEVWGLTELFPKVLHDVLPISRL